MQARLMFEMGNTATQVFNQVLDHDQWTHANLKYLRNVEVVERCKRAEHDRLARDFSARVSNTRSLSQAARERAITANPDMYVPDIDLDFPSSQPSRSREIPNLWPVEAIEEMMEETFGKPRAKKTSLPVEEPGPKKRKYT